MNEIDDDEIESGESADASGLDVRDPSSAAEHEEQGYRFRLHAADAAKLRELAGARGKADETLVAELFSGQARRWAESLSGTLPSPTDVRVVIDPYSRQAFLAHGRTVYSIVSF